MNLLAKVKSSNEYNYIVDSLYKDGGTIPITDTDGETALLNTDGTSYVMNNGEWERIEQSLDVKILESIYPFLMSICQMIHNAFIQYPMTTQHKGVVFEYKDNTNQSIVQLVNLEQETELVEGDFVWIHTFTNDYLTKVLANENGTIEFDNNGVGIRVTGKEENVCLCLVSYPPAFLSAAMEMLGYDLFIRDSKEVKSERLGNYTYTNFEPNIHNGDNNAYPRQMLDTIKYWQRVYV